MRHEIFVIHRHDPRNIGDMSCAPTSYLGSFPWLRDAITIDIENDLDAYAERLQFAHVILGGGGLLGTGFFDNQLRQLMDLHPPKMVVWGAGHNNHDAHEIHEPDYLRRFGMVGVRDYGQAPYEWVPCPSAMMPYLSHIPAAAHPVVVYRHWDDDFAGLLSGDQGVPTLANNHPDLAETIAFLASGETVVTNSYHGAYWATLMRRKVVVVSPFSSKFFGLRYPAPIVTDGDWRDALPNAKLYPGALRECRQKTRSYAHLVQSYLES